MTLILKTMKIIRNKWIPFKGYDAMCICNLILARNDAKISDRILRHESIHAVQWKECLYLFFLPIYIGSFVWQFFHYWKWMKAYENVCFEREAYAHAHEVDYLEKRKSFAWLKKQNS